MSGVYPDVPGNRMAYQKDGSAGFFINEGNVLAVLSAANLNTFNDESDTSYRIWPFVSGSSGTSTRWVGILFPELRDIVGFFYAGTNPNLWGGPNHNVQTSPDTTTGLDGTWTTLATPTINGTTQPNYRTAIQTVTANGKKGIRYGRGWSANGHLDLYSFHVYGKPSVSEIRYLMFTDTGGTEVTGAYFDYGDDPRGGGAETKSFKIKNGHGTLTANGIVLSCSTLTNKSPSFADDYMFSPDDVTYSMTWNIGNLAPGASSPTYYVRRLTPIGAALGLENPLFEAVATSWA